MPAPVRTAAASSANPARVVSGVPAEHHPRPGLLRAGARAASGPVPPSRPGPRRGSSGWAPAPIAPRRPAVPNSSRPRETGPARSAAGRPAGRVVPASRVEQFLQISPVCGAGIVGDPGPDPVLQFARSRVSGSRVSESRVAGSRVSGSRVAGNRVSGNRAARGSCGPGQHLRQQGTHPVRGGLPRPATPPRRDPGPARPGRPRGLVTSETASTSAPRWRGGDRLQHGGTSRPGPAPTVRSMRISAGVS